MSKAGKKATKGSSSSSKELQELFVDDNPKVAIKPSNDFTAGLSDAAQAYIKAQVFEGGDVESGKAASAFQQLNKDQQADIKRSAVRYVVMKSLSGQGVINGNKVADAVMVPGKYGNAKDLKHINGGYLISLVTPTLERVFGLTVNKSFKTFTMTEFNQGDADNGLQTLGTNFIVRHAVQPEAQTAQLERNSLETARRGLLFTVLGIILVDAEKAMGQDTLYGHVSRALHLSDGSEESEASTGHRVDGLANWKEIISKDFVEAGYLVREARSTKAEQPEEVAIRRAAAGISSKEDKVTYRIGPVVRGTTGTTALLEFVCQLTGTALPAPDKLKIALGPEYPDVTVPGSEAVSGKKRRRDDEDK